MKDPDAAALRGVLLFAHGARDPRWAEPFAAVAAAVRRADPQRVVALAFLEFMAPDLRTAGDAMAAQGCKHVDVVPLFLGAGGHVRKDLPALLETLAAAHPAVSWCLQTAIGERDAVVVAMAREALVDAPAGVPHAGAAGVAGR